MGKRDKGEKLVVPADIFSLEKKDGIRYMQISIENAHKLLALLDASLNKAEGTGEKYISSPRLNDICEIEARFLEKVLDRTKDGELNTFDLYQDIETLFLLHQMHMDSLSLVQKVRKKQKC